MSEQLRYTQLHNWLMAVLPAVLTRLGWDAGSQGDLVPASSDASFRRYYRWRSAAHSLIVMDAPPQHGDQADFIRIAGHLADVGLHVPHILARHDEQGFLLLTDIGTHTYLDVLTSENADSLFGQACASLMQMQAMACPVDLPEYDEALLLRELSLYPEWYLGHARGIELTVAQRHSWQSVCERLVESALAQKQVFVHRDFMPRNLMISDPNPGILDFQDAVRGPVTYDVMSLFKDAFISWPESRVLEWLQQYWCRAGAAGLPVPVNFDEFLRDCDLMGVQRHLKVIGIFARICHRDGKPKYLTDAGRFFQYIHTVLARRPELAELGSLLLQE